jgi:hypothetical protein
MKRLVAAVLAAAAAGAAVVALVPAGSPAGLGAAWAAAGRETAAAGCDLDGVGTALRTAFDPVLGYMVVAVAVDGIDARCAGHGLSVALTDGPGMVSAQGGPTLVPPGGGGMTVVVPPVAADAVARVHTLLD